jgi:hypothetical protein
LPELDWKAFRALQGSPWRNWELLCYGLVQRNFGRYGKLVAARVQPIVEFYLTLTEDCPGLGKKGEQWGWQCKFWDELTPKLNSSRKNTLTEAFAGRAQYLPDLDHLVIWTPLPLRAADLTWIQQNEPTGVEVHTWWGDQVSNLLTGSAAPLFATYFGGGVLEPEQLRVAQEDTEATLLGLKPEIHVTVRAEKALDRLRGRREDWDEVVRQTQGLRTRIEAVESIDLLTLNDAAAGARRAGAPSRRVA